MLNFLHDGGDGNQWREQTWCGGVARGFKTVGYVLLFVMSRWSGDKLLCARGFNTSFAVCILHFVWVDEVAINHLLRSCEKLVFCSCIYLYEKSCTPCPGDKFDQDASLHSIKQLFHIFLLNAKILPCTFSFFSISWRANCVLPWINKFHRYCL